MIAPLSDAQIRLWTVEKQLGAGAAHVFSIAHELVGPLDERALGAAIDHVARLHPALRVRVGVEDGRWVFFRTDPPRMARREVGPDEDALTDALSDAARAEIDLESGPGWRPTLVSISPTRFVLHLQFHHLIADRASVGVFGSGLSAAYQALIGGELPDEPAPPDNPVLAARTPTAEQSERLTGFWRSVFASAPGPLEIPGALTHDLVHSYEGARIERWLGGDRASAARETATSLESSLFTVLLGAFAATLYAHTSQDDMVVCTPMAGRHRAGTRRAIGYFNNIVPLRLDLSGDPTFAELVTRIGTRARDAMTHQDAPFDAIARLPSLDGARLTHCLFSLQNTPGLALDLPGIETRHFDVANGTANFDIALFIEELGGDAVLLMDRKPAVVGPHAAEALLGQYFRVLDHLCSDPLRRLSELPRLDAIAPDPLSQPPPAAPPGEPVRHESRSAKEAELERRITDVWREVFSGKLDRPQDEIDGDSHFFAAGGDSLRAAELLVRIEEEFGHTLPLATLIEAPTPGLLARRLIDEDWEAPFLTLLPVRPSGSRPPVYCLHGGGGNVLQFGFVADKLHEEQPLYCLQPYELERGALSSVEEMAEHYLEVIRRFQPHGPYLFAGSSLGAAVAMEMAQRVLEDGEDVPFLGFIDWVGPGAHFGPRDRIKHHWSVIRAMSWMERLEYVERRVRRRLGLPSRIPTSVQPTNQVSPDLLDAYMQSLIRYAVRPYPGHVVLFRAAGGAMSAVKDPQGGWGGYVDGVDIYDIPGDHISMTHPPQVYGLASAFSEALEKRLAVTGAN